MDAIKPALSCHSVLLYFPQLFPSSCISVKNIFALSCFLVSITLNHYFFYLCIFPLSDVITAGFMPATTTVTHFSSSTSPIPSDSSSKFFLVNTQKKNLTQTIDAINNNLLTKSHTAVRFPCLLHR